jgi:TonB-linked SusC/RagA family outer membrane protein
MRKFLTSLLGLVLFIAPALAQNIEVTGKITDQLGSPISGASIKVKGTKTGTSAGVDGSFKITVPPKSILQISAVGFKTFEVAANSVITVSLSQSGQELTEVIVTALGVRREKKSLSSAVVDVKAEQIQQKSEPDLLRSLTGKVAGVNITAGGGAPGQSTKINIRGNTSFTGNNQPLIVVDGIPFDNSVNAASGFANNSVTSNRLYDVDPNNIESMTVLKGANAAALYGNRAANGAILITTKSGLKGKKKGLEVTFNTSGSIEQLSSIPDYQDVYGQGSNQNYNGGFVGNFGAPFGSQRERINSQLGYPKYNTVNAPDSVPHPLWAVRDYTAVFPEYKNQKVPYVPHDIIGGFFRNGYVLENSINIQATGDKTSLTAGASRTTNEGIIPNSKTSRTAFNFGGNAKLTNGLTVSGNVNYVNTQQTSPQSGASFFFDYGTGGDGSSLYSRLFYLPRNYNLNLYPFENPADGSNVFYRALDNPRWIAKYNLYNSNVDRIFGNLSFSYDVTPWLNLVARGGINTYSDKQNNYIQPGGTQTVSAAGQYWEAEFKNTELNFTYLATVKKSITPDIDFTGTVGLDMNEIKTASIRTTGLGIIVTGLKSLRNTQSVTNDFNSISLLRNYGVLANLVFSYKNYLFLNFTGRNDFNSSLPVANRSFFYPSAGLGFVFTDAFKMNSKVLNYGKFRYSTVKVGGSTGPYQTKTVYIVNPAGGSYQGNNGSRYDLATLSNTNENPNLTPSFTYENEFGLDLQFFNNRIGIDATYFQKRSNRQIIPVSVPASSGFLVRRVNAGEVKNNGIEIGLSITPLKTKNFSWTSNFAFNRIRSEVTDAGPSGELFLGGSGLSSTGTIHRKGQPFGMIFGSKYARDEATGQLLIEESQGKPILLPTSDIIGNPQPDFTLGINNIVKYKNFELSFLFDWRQGGDLYSITAGSLILRGQLNNKYSLDREGLRVIPGVYGNPQTFKAILDDKGQPIKNTASITAFDYHFTRGYGGYGADETNIYDATTFRLREVTLTYTLPATILKKTPFGSARFSLSGRNLWFTAPNMLEGLNFDPEVLSNFADSNIQGFDFGASPSTRRIGINLSLTF